MMIVVVAITMTVGTSLKSYARADTHSRAINAARFTVDSFKRTVYPKVVTTNEIEILLKKDLTATVASDDINYLFLNNDGAVAVRNTAIKEETLPLWDRSWFNPLTLQSP
ncbi:MAG: hypothetical protein LUE09_07615 [Synergistaceae bacterium]|nr:hypothetical protein [Synergistaceae bacterium]